MGNTPVIDRVRVRDLVAHVDQRGSLTEVLRSDWAEFERFGQALVTVNLPGIIRGWHWHRRQTDVIVVVQGKAVLPLYDGREGSPTNGKVDEHVADDEHRFALCVPPGVYHGYKTLGPLPALILNFPTRTYDVEDPDEERVPHDAPFIPNDWAART